MGEIGWIISCGVECSETARVHVVKLFLFPSVHTKVLAGFTWADY